MTEADGGMWTEVPNGELFDDSVYGILSESETDAPANEMSLLFSLSFSVYSYCYLGGIFQATGQ